MQLVIVGSKKNGVIGNSLFGKMVWDILDQPLEIGIVLLALGGFLIIKARQNSNLKAFLPFSILTPSYSNKLAWI